MKDPDENIADSNNYRPIALTNAIFKIFEGVLKNRLFEIAQKENWISPSQYGFQPGKGTAMQIFNLRESVLEQKRKNLDIHIAFMDLSKAFDSCWRAGIFKKLHEFGVRGKFWKILTACYDQTLLSVRTRHGRSKAFETSAGVLQGSLISPILFLILINGIHKIMEEENIEGIKVGSTKVKDLLYADDLVLLAKTPSDLQKMLNLCAKYGIKWRLRFNPKKTKILFHSKDQQKPSWSLIGDKVETKKVYKYLGILFENWGEKLPQQTTKMVKKFSKKCQRVRWIISEGACFSPQISAHLYKSLCRPLLEYGAQAVPANSLNIEALEKEQTRQLKMFLGLKEKTKNETVRLLSGIESLASRWEKLKLLFVNKICHAPKSWLVRQIWEERRGLNDPYSLFSEVQQICKNLEIEISTVENSPEPFFRNSMKVLAQN